VAFAEARQVLVQAGLLRLEPDGAWLVHAAAARYTVRASIAEPGAADQASLFAEEEQ
jgi:hypothetical protein